MADKKIQVTLTADEVGRICNVLELIDEERIQPEITNAVVEGRKDYALDLSARVHKDQQIIIQCQRALLMGK